MKNLKLILAALCLLVSARSATAQTNSKVIALVTKANWCHVCKANGERVFSEVLSQYQKGDLSIVINDLSNEETIAGSKKDLAAAGIEGVADKSKKTGIITLIDRKNKKVVGSISVARPSAEIKAFIDNVMNKAEDGKKQ